MLLLLPGFLLPVLTGAQSCSSSSSTPMPIVQNSHRIAINASVNGNAFSFASYVAPNFYQDATFKPKQGHVWVHGQNRDGDAMVRTYKASIGGAVDAGYIQSDGDVVVLSLVFAHAEDEAKSLFPGVLTWCGNLWMEGGDADVAPVSSFNVLRAAFDWLAQKYPSIDTFVVGGHSAGGQTVQRWAVVNPTDPIPNRYIIANPSSVAYFTPERPNCNATSTCACFAPGYTDCCANFNDWKNGLDNYPHRFQKAAMTAADKTPVVNRYLARTIHYLYGTADNSGTNNGCGPNAQGLGHFDRGQKWWAYLTANWPQVSSTQTIDNVEGVGHDSTGIWSSVAGLRRVYGN
ncbi:hypothetical protein AURDEDRAFT_115982, partial [Auricularia subglabra TFB-10046 SS5]